MILASGFKQILNVVWDLMQTEISFAALGVDASVTLFQIMVGSVAVYELSKLLNFFMGERSD